MKKNVLYLLLGLFFAFTTTSCDEDSLSNTNVTDITEDAVVSKEAFLKSDYDDRANYGEKYLTVLGKSVLSLIKVEGESFKRSVYEEVKKEFDGDFNVLLETIYNREGVDARRSTANEFLEKNDVFVSVDEALEAFDFTDTDAVKYFPQIYIPFFEEHSKKGAIDNKMPIIAIYDGTDTEQLVGYTTDSIGNIVELHSLVSEETAKNEEVWVISINENVEKDEDIEGYKAWREEQKKNSWVEDKLDLNKAKISQAPYNSCPDGNTEPFFKPPLPGIDVRMENFIISTHKEPWHSGRSEVYAKLTTSGGSGKSWTVGVTSNGLPKIVPFGDVHLKEVRRKDVGCGKLHSFIGKSIVTSDGLGGSTYWGPWAGSTPGDERKGVMFMVIYEKDDGVYTTEKSQYVTSDIVGSPGFPYSIRHKSITVNIPIQTRESSPYYITWFTWYQDDVYPCLHYDGPRGAYDDSQCEHFLLRTWNPND